MTDATSTSEDLVTPNFRWDALEDPEVFSEVVTCRADTLLPSCWDGACDGSWQWSRFPQDWPSTTGPGPPGFEPPLEEACSRVGAVPSCLGIGRALCGCISTSPSIQSHVLHSSVGGIPRGSPSKTPPARKSPPPSLFLDHPTGDQCNAKAARSLAPRLRCLPGLPPARGCFSEMLRAALGLYTPRGITGWLSLKAQRRSSLLCSLGWLDRIWPPSPTQKLAPYGGGGETAGGAGRGDTCEVLTGSRYPYCSLPAGHHEFLDDAT